MKKLTRSSDSMLGGVLGGIANFFEIDPVWVRLGFLLFALLINFGIALFLYILALFIMPKEGFVKTNESSSGTNNSQTFLILGIGLIIVGAFFLFEQIFDLEMWRYMRQFYFEIKRFFWPVLLIFIGLWVVFQRKKK